MSGLEEITAIFAIVELGVKSLSAVYNLIQTLRHIPTRIQQAKDEVGDILNCLAGLRFIQTADSGTIRAIDQAGLKASVSSCREACDALRGLISTWDPQQSRISAKLKYFRHREAFDGLLNDITNRKQNTTLALGVTQLSLQVSSKQAAIRHFKTLEHFMAQNHTCLRMAERHNPDSPRLPQPDDGLQVTRSCPEYDSVAASEQSSPSTTNASQPAYSRPSELHNRVTPWARQRGTDFAEHQNTNGEGLERRGNGVHVFDRVIHVFEKIAQVFEKGVYIDGGIKNKVGMTQSVAKASLQKSDRDVLQVFGGEVRIGPKSRGNQIGIYKD